MPERNVRPTDVFPRRNLPGSAEQWGRTVESRIVTAETEVLTLKQSAQGINRSTASSLSSLADQLNRLVEMTRVVGVSATIYNTPGFAPIWAGGSILAMRPAWATHAIVEFTALTITDPGDMTGEVAVSVVAYDIDEGPGGGQLSATFLVDSANSFAIDVQPLVVEVPSVGLEFGGWSEPTIGGAGDMTVQLYMKITWITRGPQTSGDV